MEKEESSGYGLSKHKYSETIDLPEIQYLPQKENLGSYKIGIIGAGGIVEYHLSNYKALGLDVVAISNRDEAKAKRLVEKFFPDADVYGDYRDILKREDIEVVDIAIPVGPRVGVVKEAILSGKNILSQKPFCEDMESGIMLEKLAREKGVRLAVNQNGRWAPHFSYIRSVIQQGLIGKVVSVDFSLQWDQTWVAGIPTFEEMKHLILYDFAIHWFDILCCIMPYSEVCEVFASVSRTPDQKFSPPALASVIVRYEQGMATLSFNGHTLCGERDVTTVVGTKGTIRSQGPGLNQQEKIELFTGSGSTEVPLEGSWFSNGFQGTMCELLKAIEEQRPAQNSVGSALEGLALCLAAVKSADRKTVIIPESLAAPIR